jgi:Ca2+-binding RTX toxin-like protein
MRRLFDRQERKGMGHRVLFGFDADPTNSSADPETPAGGRDELIGNKGADRLYGGGGNDVLRGDEGGDYLQGDAGNDRLFGEADNDTLLGGKGNDILLGGTGTDKYYFYTGGGSDTVIDTPEGAVGPKRQLGEIYFGGADGDIRIFGAFSTVDPDRKHFTLTASDGRLYQAAYLGDLVTATPGKLVLWRDDDGSNVVTLTAFISGDFGIVLDPNAPTRQFTDKLGTEGSDNDFITGGPHAGSLSSDSPDQKVFGLGGADFILVSHANAQAVGGDGNDFLMNGEGDQALFGDAGRDVIVATSGEDRLEGGADDDALQGGADGDYLDGGEGDDVLDGGAGADVIAGGAGNDFIFGGGTVTVAITDWNAFADGSLDWGAVDASGDVLLRGLAGVSNVEGDAGDVITAGAGNDWVFAGDGLDAVSGGEGNDYLVGQAGNDSLSGEDGADILYGDGAEGDLVSGVGFFSVFTLPHAHGADTLRGGPGNDFLSGDGGADELYGDDDDDTLIGDSANVPEEFHGADYLDGGAGNDLLLGYGKGDTLFGGAGNDELGGDSSTIAGSLHGEDYLDGEDGDDVLHGDGGADELFGGSGNDVLDGDASNVAFEFHGDDYLDGEEDDDALQGGGGADRLFGGAGNDSLVGDGPGVPDAFSGADYLDGEAGNDVLEGGAGDDTLVGGAGSDILRGQAGDDLYIVTAGDQQDFIEDREGLNTVRFDSGASFATVTVSQALASDGNVYLSLRHGTADIVFVRDGLTNETFRYEFADGTVTTAADWRERFDVFADAFGTSGADTMAGSALADAFFPGGGNDTILFGPGSGFDRVGGFGQVAGEFQGLDVVRVGGGLTADDLDVRRSADGNLTLTLRESGDLLQIDGWGAQVSRAHAGPQVVFDDGSGLSAAELIARALTPTDGDDTLFGGAGPDLIAGGAGDDRLFGNNSSNPVNGGNDHNVLLGGEGNDLLQGGFGDDVLDGGPGDDTLNGVTGADTYRWGLGDGNDVVTAGGHGEGNVLELKPGLAPADVTLTQGSIVITVNATGEALTLSDWYAEVGLPSGHTPFVTVEEIRFADGTVWDASLINEAANHATPFADRLRGIFTPDVLHGLGGDDLIEGFAGDDVLSGGDGDDTLVGGAGADELAGGAGNDILRGSAGDVLDGGAGDDLLDGGSVYIFGVGDGFDRILGGGAIEFAAGIDPLGVCLRFDGAALVLDYGSGQVQLPLGAAGDPATQGIELVRFADGTQWNRDEIQARLEIVPRQFAGTQGADTLVGSDGDDVIDGGAGHDVLAGGAGDDVLLGGEGADTLNGGDGDDFLDGGTGDDQMNGGLGSDTYRLGLDTGQDTVIDALLDPFLTWTRPGDLNVIRVDEGIAPSELAVSSAGGDLLLETAASSLRVGSWFAGELGPGPLTVRFADGTEWDTAALMALAGVAPPDSLDDVLAGTPGDDLLQGGLGNDTYLFGFGSGNDVIEEPFNTLDKALNRATAGARDTIRFGPGVTPQDVFVEFLQDRPTFHLAGSGDTLTVFSWADAAAGRVEFAAFEDGTVWDLGRFSHWRTGTTAGPNVPDIVTGSKRHFPGISGAALGLHDEVFFGQASSDLISSNDGHHVFYGGAGNDTLFSGSGDDQLDSGAGNDSLLPGTGDNRIRFGRGFGQDTLNLSNAAANLGVDTIALAQDVRPEQIRLRRGPNASLILELAGTPDSLTVNGPLRGLAGRDRLRFEFADGTLWDPDEIEARIQTIAVIEGGTGNNVLTGGDGDDLFIGGQGNDTLIGGGGADTFVFHRGDGIDTINDRFPRIVFGEDIAPGDVTLVGTNFAFGQRDLHLVVAGGGGQLILLNWFDSTLIDGSIDFADGTVWDAGFIGARVPYAWTSGQTGFFFGTPGNDAFATGATNDTLRGQAGDDTLSGSDGNDQLFGGEGRDVLSGGAGNDMLQGEAGDDALDAGAGDDQLAGGSGADVLDGGAGNDALSGGADDDVLGGGEGDDILEGGFGDDMLDGGAGDDRLYGGTGSDSYLFGLGSGHDTLLDFDGMGTDIDIVLLGEGISPEDLVLARQAGDILITVGGGGDSLVIRSFGRAGYGIERLVFAGGTEWDGAELAARAALPLARERDDVIYGGADADVLIGLGGDDYVDGGAGNDFLDGGAGDDVLVGGPGDDLLEGGAGSDHLTGGEGLDDFRVGIDSGSDSIADLGAGDALSFGSGIAPDAVRIARDVDHLYLELVATGQFVTLENWFAGVAGGGVAFDDGTAWDGAFLKAQVDALTEGDDFFVGSALADTIATLAGLDVVFAGAGDDHVSGGSGSDTLHGEAGNDILLGEAGYDLLHGGEGDDTLEGGADDDALFGDAGNDVLHAGDGFDELAGDGGDDILDGGTGDDILRGGLGGDTYLFGPGYGHDVIVENDPDTANTDTILIDTLSSDVSVAQAGADVRFTLAGGTDHLTVQGWFSGSAMQVEEVRFLDGTLWDAATVTTLAVGEPPPQPATQTVAVQSAPTQSVEAAPAALVFTTLAATLSAGGDFHRGSGGNDLLEALAGDDTVFGGPGNDAIIGGEGDDFLGGESGDDLLDGGPGRDILEGGAGNDRYAFGAGYGEDWAIDTGGADEVVVDASLAPASVAFSRDLANLYMTAGADRLVLVDWFHRAETRIETFRFADGTLLDEAAIRLALQVPASSAAADTIFGSDRGETLLGLAGEDTLYGEGGDDVLDGGAGSDYLVGGAGDDTYHVDNRLDRVTEFAGEGSDTVIASSSYALSNHAEDLLLTGAGALSGTGNAQDNTITGNAGANVLRGAGGDDLLRGGAGNDVYLYERGDGSDRIEDVDATPGNADEVRFGEGISSADVRVSRIDADLRLGLRGGVGEILVGGWFDPVSRVETVRFADGTSWDAAMLEFLASLPQNEPPELAQPIADLGVLEDATFTYALQPATFVDADVADTLVFTATQADGTALPAWLAFGETDGTFAGTPANEDVGEYTIRVSASDPAGESVADEFVLTVINVNDAPVLAAPVADPSIEAGSEFTLALAAGTFTDVDQGDVISYSASRADGAALPDWLSFDAVSRTFSGTPAESDAGPFDVRVTATDSAGAAASDEFRITVIGSGAAGEHLVGSNGADTLVGTRHADVLEGRKGNDLLLGLAGDDVYLYEKGDGHDLIIESGGLDRLRFGEGIGERDVAVLRRHGDLVLKVKGEHGSVTVKNWFLADNKRVERVEFASGGAWDESDLRARAGLWHGDGWFDAPAHGHDHDHRDGPRDDGGHGRPARRDDDGHELRNADDAIETRLERAAHFDFSALAEHLARGAGDAAAAMSTERIASRWDSILRAMGLLAQDDEDAGRGWDRGRDEEAGADRWHDASGWGHPGSTGQRAGVAGLRSFAGLAEGFRSLG